MNFDKQASQRYLPVMQWGQLIERDISDTDGKITPSFLETPIRKEALKFTFTGLDHGGDFHRATAIAEQGVRFVYMLKKASPRLPSTYNPFLFGLGWGLSW